ncbi:MAG: hypothetical protein LVQ97_02460 [Candidatus Micrarchaeales archaeon]|uniref:Uncharacterized protein n=1 Tax=Candidatus Micrarchaeum acidiphilum ARMAN-2 TaxID=425595 RepID=C7DIJ5_MICA2|nr:MAG: hypothetical protein UNLARM2_0883 [Candidatus Micrarchaeum acidiphilum ARMAN-2]MCW6161024.1 hypothetical protein [Candidatus Micrarchaeales archaeon]
MKLSGGWNRYVNTAKKPIAIVRADFANADPKVLGQQEHIDAPTAKRKSSAFATISGILIVVGIVLFIGSMVFSGGDSNSINSTTFLYPPVLILAAIMIVIGVLYLGFSYFAVHMMVANTPIVKMEAASTGLGILEAKLESESGNTISAPLAKAKCTFYDVSLFAYYTMHQGSYSSTVTYFLDSDWKGEATYLTDGTGYTALPFEKVDGFLPKANTYMLYDNSGEPIKIKHMGIGPTQYSKLAVPDNVASLRKMLEDARNSGTDLSLDAITGSTGISFVPIGSKKSALKAGYYYIIESYLPVDQSYATAGYLEHTDETLRGKPVNVMIRDTSNTNLFSMVEGQKSTLSKKEFRNSVVSFAVAAIIVLLLAWLAPVHSMYSCLVLETNNSGPYCHYINGSTIALLGSAPSQHYTTTIPISTSTITSSSGQVFSGNCGTLNLSSSSTRSTSFAICTWKGGIVNIFAGGGNSGFVSFKIIGANGVVYVSNYTNSRCATSRGSIYLPAQNYRVQISTGGGGGSCGAAEILLSG